MRGQCILLLPAHGLDDTRQVGEEARKPIRGLSTRRTLATGINDSGANFPH